MDTNTNEIKVQLTVVWLKMAMQNGWRMIKNPDTNKNHLDLQNSPPRAN
jgi:hypothetical protein